ncbi:MAG: trigger factor [Chloroflexi bacterium]|nr:trigger factor [Chloroflexota bacterium]MBU1747887.1 trigger factor [Chloroflexota bacterium]
MNITTQVAPDSQVILTVAVDQERMEKALDRAYRQIVKRVNVPGFRRGKAPRAVLERHVGRGTLLREALEPLLDDVYREAVEAEDLHPISSPEAELVEVDPPTFRFTVSVRPTIALGDYESLRFAMPEVVIDETEMDATLERVRESQSTWEPVDRPAQIGDQLLVDMAGGIADGLQIDRENDVVMLADPAEGLILGPGIIEQLVGVQAGETRHVTTHYPADSSDAELAGQTAEFDITVHTVSEQHMPPLDDDLAVAAGDFADLAALRDHIRQILIDNAEQRAQRQVRDQMINALMAEGTVEAPAALIETELDEMMHEFQDLLRQQQGITLEQYLTQFNQTQDELRAEMRNAARERVRRALALGEFARLQELDTTDAEVDAEIERVVQNIGGDTDRMRAALNTPERRAQVENQLMAAKIDERLLAIATQPAVEPAAAEDDDTVREQS